jgi:hypothetical protein
LKRRSKTIIQAGHEPGTQISITLDPAASEFYDKKKKKYVFKKSDGSERTSEQMAEFWADLVSKYPIISIERRHGRGRFGQLGRLSPTRSDVGSASRWATTFSLPTPSACRWASTRASRTRFASANQIGSLNVDPRSHAHGGGGRLHGD